MAGTIEGGRKAAITNRLKHGDDFYSRIGHKGGSKSNNGGFASDKIGKDGLTGRERAKVVGAKGGSISSRAGVKNGDGKTKPRKANKVTNTKVNQSESIHLWHRLFRGDRP
jgi:general stress protein YciG